MGVGAADPRVLRRLRARTDAASHFLQGFSPKRLRYNDFLRSGAIMPIYEYRCATCGHQKEYLQKVSDPRLTDCPQCGKATFEKMLSAAGFQLKGSGWYVTDFRDNGSKPKDTSNQSKGAKEKTDTAAAETKKEQKSESKSESPAATPPASPASPA
ncbi:MAG TPA: zinc ribbon domain-containing protein, partial [Burkholderiales bacterium]|nr:zinc ribbon domain-containing protein [Burkholderiales bacterium]